MDKKDNIISYHTFMLPFIVKDKAEIINGWSKSNYDVDYNESTYFHSFFKNSMFEKNVEFYKKQNLENQELIIKTSKNEYKLNLENINLRVFDTGIAILTINIENKTYKEIDDILEVNDFARRIYPEYLDKDKGCDLVAKSIELNGVVEDFKYENRPLKPKISKIISHFVPSLTVDDIVVDDRMFTISFFKNENFALELQKDYELNDNWYKYIFIDGNGLNVQNKSMQKELTKNATYHRWQNYNTMYGISRYSFVCLSSSVFPLPYMQTMYFSMFSLLLMVHSTVLKFSKEVSEIAYSIDDDKTAQKVEDLYKRYIKFVNDFYFREITAKDQGIEIYEKALSVLNIKRDIEDLDAEIEELHKFVEMKQEKKTSETLNFLTLLGGILLPPSLVTGFFGMNSLKGIDKYSPYFDMVTISNWSSEIAIGSMVIIPIYLFCKKLFSKGKK